jgi:hypothetical protein
MIYLPVLLSQHSTGEVYHNRFFLKKTRLFLKQQFTPIWEAAARTIAGKGE